MLQRLVFFASCFRTRNPLGECFLGRRFARLKSLAPLVSFASCG
ncbi:hypothetical protein [Campylobacter troglodytis]|nr:hypothetical protein [Campylobacter troglodytis]